MKVFLVGGAVRDILMGREPKDRDYVVIGSTPEEMIAQGFKQVGADFPVFLHPETGEEYALARIERKIAKGYHGFATDFSPEIKLADDLKRRDLTINSMAMDIETGELHDYFGGQKDLELMILRHTSEAFAEDPVRILRVARFAARYGFDVDESTIDLMRAMVLNGEFDNLVPERVWAEFAKGLMETHPQQMFFNLDICGALERLPFYNKVRKNFVWPKRERGLVHTAAVMFENRTIEEFRDNRVPTDVSDLAITADKIQRFVATTDAGMFNDEKVLDFFMEVDLFRRLDRYVAASLVVKDRGYDLPMSLVIKSSMVLSVDAGAIAQKCLDPKEIKNTIYNARLEAMK